MHLTRANDVVDPLIRVESQRVHVQGPDDTHDLVRPGAELPTGRPVAEAPAEGVPTLKHPLDEALIGDHGGPVPPTSPMVKSLPCTTGWPNALR